jgi:MoaA/NifB/PqqE/SkfB family radical SAM enzyme
MLNQITIINTLRCDLKCQHCLRGFPKERPDFPMDLLDKLLAEALPFGAKHVALTGGEPHLHPEFEKMVDKIVAYGYTWHFVSHGQRTEPYLRVMERYKNKVSHVALSIDGATADTHDEIRNRKGAFEKVVASTKEYVKRGYKVRVCTSLNKKNKNEVEGILKLAGEIGAYGINLAGTTPTSWNSHLVLNDQESLELYEKIAKLSEGLDLHVRTLSSLYTRGGVTFCNVLKLHDLMFNPRGEMIFCCDTEGIGAVTGSLRKHTLADLVILWLKQSNQIQTARAEKIAGGNIGEKFDTCAYCNAHFSQEL